MPFVAFDKVDEGGGAPALIPDGWYKCRVVKVNEKQTKAGAPMFGVAFEVTGGDHKGRWVWDNLVFSEGTGYQRLKMACGRMGLDVSKGRDITPDDLIGREVMVNIQQDEYVSGDTVRTKNCVPFEGYEEVVDIQSVRRSPDEETPF